MIAALAGAVLIVVLPGAVAAYALGLRGLHLIGLAGPLSVALTAGIAVLLAPLNIPFLWWQPLAAAVLGLVIRVLVRRRLPAPPLSRRGLGVVAAIAVSGAAAGLLAFGGLSLDAVNSTYDGIFHLNAVAYILSTGDGSSLDLYRMTHPGTDLEFYPAAWHDLVAAAVQLTGSPIPLATNATWIAVTGAVWIPGVVYLAATAFGGAGRVRVALLAAPLATVFAAAPYLLLDWGTLFPTGLAYALLPSGLALVVLVLRVIPQPEGARVPPAALAASALLWTAAAGLAHPRSLFGLVVLALPLVLLQAARIVARWWAAPGGPRRVLLIGGGALAAVVAAGVVGWIYVYRTFDVAHRPISDHLNGGPATAHQDMWQSFLQALLGAPVVSPAETAVSPTWLLSLVVVAALVVAAVTPEWRWATVAWLLVVVLYCLAAGSNSDVAKLATGIWYKDKYRLISLLPVITAPLAAGALARYSRTALAGSRSRGTAAAAVLALVTAGILAASWFGPTLSGTRAAIATSFAVPAGAKNGALLDQDELKLLERLPGLTPKGAVIVGNPWNGSTLSWAVGGRESLFPHLTGDWDADRLTVANRLDQLRQDPEVCAALRRLGASYLITAPGLLWNGDPQAGAFAAIDRTDPAAIGQEIGRQGEAVLYRITACD